MARNKNPQDTVELILGTASKLFITKGYDETSLQDIINGLGGLSKGAVYHHFSSKEEIFEEAFGRILKKLSDHTELVSADTNLNGKEKVEKALILNDDARNKYVDAVKSIRASRGELGPRMEKLILEFARNDLATSLTPLISEGIKDGSIKCDCAESLAEMLALTLVFYGTNQVVNCDPEEYKGKMNFVYSMFNQYGLELGKSYSRIGKTIAEMIV